MTHKDSVINTLKSSLSNSTLNTNKDFEKDMENRRLKVDINDLKSKIEILNDEISIKSDENKGYKLELIDLASEVKNLHSELIRKDQQVFNLKDKIHELNLEVRLHSFILFNIFIVYFKNINKRLPIIIEQLIWTLTNVVVVLRVRLLVLLSLVLLVLV
jgi:predicted nuclease with TOPRIM domain